MIKQKDELKGSSFFIGIRLFNSRVALMYIL